MKLNISGVVLAVVAPMVVWADGPGSIEHRWAPALKQAIGTAFETSGARSPVWFTLAQGIVTEVYYPTVDQPQIGDLQFLVTDGKSYFSEQKRDVASSVSYADRSGATVLVSSQERSGAYSFSQEIVTDPASPVVKIRTRFHRNRPDLHVYLLFKPAINGAGSNNNGQTSNEGLFASAGSGSMRRSLKKRVGVRRADSVVAAVVSSTGYASTSAGYVGTDDGWQDLSRHFQLTNPARSAGPGNIALTGELDLPQGQADVTWETALAFGATLDEARASARQSLDRGFDTVRERYESGWSGWLQSLGGGGSWLRNDSLASRSAMVIKMHEDKQSRGGIVASMSSPGIPDRDTAAEDVGGYHLVWPRDLYHAAMGLLAAGDIRTPIDVLQFLKSTQLQSGAWYQNFWTDGSKYWSGLQLDEVAFPILLAHQLEKRGVHPLDSSERDMVRRAADFIVRTGPTTPQDRWEEIGGYLPNTIAVEIAGLRAASRLTGDSRYATLADSWAQSVASWTLVSQGPHGQNYFLRVSPSGHPNNPETINIANGGGSAQAWDILDGGFLDLVRLGVLNARDPAILSTLAIYDSPQHGVAGDAGNGGLTYRRYNHDGYGYQHVGGYWPILAGERGHYALLAGDRQTAVAQLKVMEAAALPTGLIPEQTVTANSSRRGPQVALGTATPLVWAHAEHLLLLRSLSDGSVFDAP